MMDTAVKVALIISIAPTLAALISLIVGVRGRAAAVKETKKVGAEVANKLQVIEVRMNGRLDELLAATRDIGFRDGRIEALKETAEKDAIVRPHRRSDDAPAAVPAVKVVLIDKRGTVRSGAGGGGPEVTTK